MICQNSECGFDFTPKRKNQKYCGSSCRKQACARNHYLANSESYKRRSVAGRDAKRAYDRFRITGWTQEEYNSSFEKQQGCCAICGKHQSCFKDALSADHCHKTGVKRALLCHYCNKAIGLMEDSPDRLEKAAKYLREFYDRPG